MWNCGSKKEWLDGACVYLRASSQLRDEVTKRVGLVNPVISKLLQLPFKQFITLTDIEKIKSIE